MKEYNYSIAQKEQILKGLKEDVEKIEEINPLCTPSQIKDYITLYTKNRDYFECLDEKNISYIVENFNKIPNTSYIPNVETIDNFKEYIQSIDIIGIENACKVFSFDNFMPNNDFVEFSKKAVKIKDFNFDIFKIGNLAHFLLKLSKDDFETVYNYLNKAVTNNKDIDFATFIYIARLLAYKNNLSLLSKIEVDKLPIYEKLDRKLFEIEDFLDKDINPLLLELAPFNYYGNHSYEIFENYEKFILDFRKETKDDKKTKHIFKFIVDFDLNGECLNDIKEKFINLSSKECDLLYETENFSDENNSISKNKVLEKVSFLFDNKFTLQQKSALIDNFKKQVALEKFIIDFVDNNFLPNQIIFLRDELLSGKEIKNACNPKFDVEHMGHIIYYNTKKITFKNDKDYDTNYTADKNKDLENFINSYEDLFGDKETSDKINAAKELLKINKEYGLNLDIEILKEDDFNPGLIIQTVKLCNDLKIDVKKTLENKTMDEISEINYELTDRYYSENEER